MPDNPGTLPAQVGDEGGPTPPPPPPPPPPPAPAEKIPITSADREGGPPPQKRPPGPPAGLMEELRSRQMGQAAAGKDSPAPLSPRSQRMAEMRAEIHGAAHEDEVVDDVVSGKDAPAPLSPRSKRLTEMKTEVNGFTNGPPPAPHLPSPSPAPRPLAEKKIPSSAARPLPPKCPPGPSAGLMAELRSKQMGQTTAGKDAPAPLSPRSQRMAQMSAEIKGADNAAGKEAENVRFRTFGGGIIPAASSSAPRPPAPQTAGGGSRGTVLAEQARQQRERTVSAAAPAPPAQSQTGMSSRQYPAWYDGHQRHTVEMKNGDRYVSLKDQGIYLQDIKAALSSPMRVTEASGYMRQSGSFFPSTSIASAGGGTAHKGLFEERHVNHHESENGRQARELQSTCGGAVGSSRYSVSYSRGSQSLAKEKDDTSDHPNWREMAWPALLANPRVPYSVARRTMTPNQNFNLLEVHTGYRAGLPNHFSEYRPLESPRSSTTISGAVLHGTGVSSRQHPAWYHGHQSNMVEMKQGDTYVSLKDQGLYLQDIKEAPTFSRSHGYHNPLHGHYLAGHSHSSLLDMTPAMHQLDRNKPGDLSLQRSGLKTRDTYFTLADSGIFHHNENLTVPAFSAAQIIPTMRTRGEPSGAWSTSNQSITGHSIAGRHFPLLQWPSSGHPSLDMTPSMSQRPVLGSGSSANVATVPLARNF